MSGQRRRSSLFRVFMCAVCKTSPSSSSSSQFEEYKEPRRPNAGRRRSILRENGYDESHVFTRSSAEVSSNQQTGQSEVQVESGLTSPEISFRTDDDLAKKLGSLLSGNSVSKSSRGRRHHRKGSSSWRIKNHSRRPSGNSILVEEIVDAPDVMVIEPEMFEVEVVEDLAGALVLDHQEMRPYVAAIYHHHVTPRSVSPGEEEKKVFEVRKVISRKWESETVPPMHAVPSPRSCRSCASRMQVHSLEDEDDDDERRLLAAAAAAADQLVAAAEGGGYDVKLGDSQQVFVMVESEAGTVFERVGGGGDRSPSVQSGKSELIDEGDDSDALADEQSPGSGGSRNTNLTHVTYQSRATQASNVDWDSVQFRRRGAGDTESAADASRRNSLNFSRTIVRAPFNPRLKSQILSDRLHQDKAIRRSRQRSVDFGPNHNSAARNKKTGRRRQASVIR
eukprot:TRINITY_DN934_c0_g1_i1.p1 TRINITY_DN934_c0_g1~~TRINITY_DN934_c0_g1_i1.p1  ORF type:complete len:450 (+),score=73.18 TRINITY_DN934_c0_g1_i1:62-1411(+)